VIIGIGVDVVSIDRFQQVLERTPTMRDRLFTDAEKVLPVGSLAGRFAAKEALAKALGAPAGLHWIHAEVVNDEHGKPSFLIHGSVAALAEELGVHSIHLSISHDGGIASAMVVAEGA
jgi:holo-[acyl-carrier protein] synthase